MSLAPNPSTAASPAPAMLPLSFAQELLWLTEHGNPGGSAYNVGRTRRLRGRLDPDVLRRALDALATRHEILRTTYGFHQDQAVQLIHAPKGVPFQLIDLRSLGAEQRRAEANRQIRERARVPFDLGGDFPLRALVVRLEEEEHLLHIDSHHIAADGWSRDVLFRDLDALYSAFAAAEEPVLPLLPIQYADYAVWQREQVSGKRLERLLAYWRSELGDADFVLDLPTDFPRQPVPGSDGVSRSIVLTPACLDGMRGLAGRHQATLYLTLLAAYTALLHRYTGSADVLVGSPVAARTLPETEGLIGYFSNTVVQRARFAGDPTFAELLTQLRSSALGAYDHQEVPFEKLVLELQQGQALSHSPIFQVVLTMLDPSPSRVGRLGDLEVHPVGGEAPVTKFDLTLFMAERPDSLALTLRGRADLFAESSIDRMLGELQLILESATRDPSVRVSRLALLSERDAAGLARANATARDLGPAATVTALIEAAVDRYPGRTAVICEEHSLTYAELERRSNQLAHHLRGLHVGAGCPVGLGMVRSTDALVGLFGILKAGGCYVPLVPSLPAARLAQQFAESGAPLIVTRAEHLDRLPEDARTICLDRDAAALASAPTSRPEPLATPEDLAYVLFTSGSTGTPKGVAVTHANLVHYVRAIGRVLADLPEHAEGNGLAALSGWSFGLGSTIAADLGNTSLFPALAAGGTLVILPKTVATEPARYMDYLEKHPLDVLKLTPGHLHALIGERSGPDLAAVLPRRWLVLGGEVLHWDQAERLLGANQCRVLNHYGPTETTVGASTYRVGARKDAPLAATVPIGRPLTNVQLHVLDRNRQMVPIGLPGELYIGGAGVARGYLNRPELTAERFVEVEGLGRLYCTGDRVRRLPEGELEFLGRLDGQVKVRGHRVELGEVEKVIGLFPGVVQCVAALREVAGSAEPVLVGYVVVRSAGYAAAHGERPTPDRLREWVAAVLPEYMVPRSVVLLDRIPLTRNGKVDRGALPSPDAEAAEVSFVAARTSTETALAQIWAEALRRDVSTISMTDDFLALGGHSLTAIRILGKISRSLGLRLPLRSLFDAPTIEQLGELVDLETRLAALERMSEESAAKLLAADGREGGR